MSNHKLPKDIQMGFLVTEDGEIVDDVAFVNNASKYNFTSKEQALAYIEKLKREASRVKDERGNYVMGKHSPLRDLETSELKVTDRARFMQLLIYAQFDGEPLKKDGIPLTVNMIADIWDMSRERTSDRLKKFVQNGLLLEIKAGRSKNFALNPLTFEMGTYKGKNFTKLFKKKLTDVIFNIEKIQARINRNSRVKRKVNLIDVMGLLHAVIPYFHYQTYYLVSNPDENILRDGESVLDAFERDQENKKPTMLKHLKKAQIGRIMGYKQVNIMTIDKYMDYLQEAGAVMVLKTNNKTRYLIHPDLMFRQDGNGLDDYTKFIRTLFGQHD